MESISPALTSVSLTITTLPGIPLVQPGDNLVQLILDGLAAAHLTLQADDILVVTSKIVSKAEDRIVRLDTVKPGQEARRVAEETGKDPRMVELVLRESTAISRQAHNVLVTQHRLGFVSANAGIDQSNIDNDRVLLLPENPDATAQMIHQRLHKATGVHVGIVISDSHGRPFRLGNVGVAIGVAGMPALLDLRGQPDLFGRELQASIQGYADMIAAAAQLVSGDGAEGRPVALLRGLQFPGQDGSASDLQRPADQDLYR